MPMRAPHVHVMGRGTMARGHHTSLNVLWLHAVEKAVSTGAAARLLREDEGEIRCPHMTNTLELKEVASRAFDRRRKTQVWCLP